MIYDTVNGESFAAKISRLRLTETIHGESFAVKLKHSYIVHCKLLI